jgi:hypothetical protein
LKLESVRLTDTGFRELLGLVELRDLNLYGDWITDVALDDVSHFKHLRTLSVGTRVSEDAAAELHDIRPDLQITRGDARGSTTWMRR